MERSWFEFFQGAVIYNHAVLLELVVENYAVIEGVRVRFHAGLNLLTGETGGGVEMVVDAFSLLLGGRASAEMVRTGAERARVLAAAGDRYVSWLRTCFRTRVWSMKQRVVD